MVELENLPQSDEVTSFEDAQPFLQLLASILNRLTREPDDQKDDTLEDSDSRLDGLTSQP